MRPLSQNADSNSRRAAQTRFPAPAILIPLVTAVFTFGCSGGVATSVASSSPPPNPAPSSVSVTLTPTTSSVLLGNAQTFTPSVTGSTNTAVSWSVNGVPGGTPATGTITAAGVYTAPQILPVLTNVTVTAQSVADPAKQASATITILSDITVALSPTVVGVELGATQPFHAAISSSGQPNPAIRWSVSGPPCPAACGALDTNGNYTAPQILPAAANATITAQSVADPAKQASAAVTITSNFSLQLSAPPSVASGGSGVIAATLTPVAGSNPATQLTWTLSGVGCSGAACGTLAVVTTQPLGGGAMSTLDRKSTRLNS